jgi:hypothetical protein
MERVLAVVDLRVLLSQLTGGEEVTVCIVTGVCMRCSAMILQQKDAHVHIRRLDGIWPCDLESQ